MLQREYRQSSQTRSSTNAYVLAMKALQDKIRLMENERNVTPQPEIRPNQETDILKMQIAELKKENEQLHILAYRSQSSQESVQQYVIQIEALQEERLQHLKDYQDRVSDLIHKNEDLKREKQELQNQCEHLQRQLQAYKQNERGFQHKAELIKYEETAKLNETVSDLRQRLEQNDFYVKKLEKKLEKLQNEKHQIDNDFIDYRERCPLYKLQEYEKQLQQLRYQLDEKEKLHLKTLDDIQSHRSNREEQLSRRITDLLNKNNELQSLVHQQTIDFKDMQLKYQQLKIRYENEEKQQVKTIVENDRSLQKLSQLNLDLVSPQITSPRYPQDQSIKHSALKQAIKECIDDMKHTTPFQIQPQQQQLPQAQSQKKKLISPPQTNRNIEQELKMKQLNDRYELLIRQAQKESDFKQKAAIRKELLELAEQIKELNRIK